jgi:hypothetical protein
MEGGLNSMTSMAVRWVIKVQKDLIVRAGMMVSHVGIDFEVFI